MPVKMPASRQRQDAADDNTIVLGAGLILPERYLGSVRNALSIKVQKPGDEPYRVNAWKEHNGMIVIPRQFGLEFARKHKLDYVDRRGKGFKAFTGCKPIKLWESQNAFVDGAMKAIKDGYIDFCGEAPTGKGKTVCSLEIARRFGKTTLVVVDQEFIRDQWIERIVEHLGIPETDVGIVQGKRKEWQDYPIVIAMMQTIYAKEMPKGFSDNFGLAIFDECHTAGAEKFSWSLLKINSTVRIGVSATVDRTDVLRKVVKYNLGDIRTRITEQHDRSVVRYIESPGVYSWYANVSPKRGRFIKELSNDPARNLILSEAIYRLYQTGRRVLAIGDSIEHVQSLLCMVNFMGVPEEDTGLVCGHYYRWSFAKDPTPDSMVGDLFSYDSEYTPVAFQLLKKKTPKALLVENKTKRIIFATYGMFSKGVDIPDLAAGVDCTPRSKAEQVHGRILRSNVVDKLLPIWVTIRDINSFRAEYQFMNRIGEYINSNAEIYLWDLELNKVKKQKVSDLRKEIKSNHMELRNQEIIMNIEGNYTTVIQNTGRKRKSSFV